MHVREMDISGARYFLGVEGDAEQSLRLTLLSAGTGCSASWFGHLAPSNLTPPKRMDVGDFGRRLTSGLRGLAGAADEFHLQQNTGPDDGVAVLRWSASHQGAFGISMVIMLRSGLCCGFCDACLT